MRKSANLHPTEQPCISPYAVRAPPPASRPVYLDYLVYTSRYVAVFTENSVHRVPARTEIRDPIRLHTCIFSEPTESHHEPSLQHTHIIPVVISDELLVSGVGIHRAPGAAAATLFTARLRTPAATLLHGPSFCA